MSRVVAQYKVAHAYAEALSDVMTEDSAFEVAIRLLLRLDTLMSRRQVLRIWSSPRLSDAQKEQFLRDIWIYFIETEAAEAGDGESWQPVHQDTVYALLRVLLQAQRLDVLSALVQVLCDLWEQRRGSYKGEMVLAQQQGQSFIEQLQQASEKAFGVPLELEVRYDARLLSGFVVKVGHRRFDASLRARLLKMRQSLDGES